ncbi:MAG TPA: hypothetical protein VGG42_00380 [Acidobacteriaceae bacterium]
MTAESSLTRRSFLQLASASLSAAALGPGSNADAQDARAEKQAVAAPSPAFRICPDSERAQAPILSWDTERGDRTRSNLLRPGQPLCLRVRIRGVWHSSFDLPAQVKNIGHGGIDYVIAVANQAAIRWRIDPESDRLLMTVAASGPGRQALEAVEILFPFDPKVTPTTILPQSWSSDGKGLLPAVLSAPDFGQLLLDDQNAGVRARLDGDRDNHTVDLTLELPGVIQGAAVSLVFTPILLAPPQGMTDTAMWQQVRRGWFNTWQPSARWGDQQRPYSAPVGILSNNVISDPVSFALPFYADQALWTPEIAPGVSVMAQVRRSIEWWLDHRTDASGEVIGYWDYRHFLDANPGIINSSWDYVEATGDHAWLSDRIAQLEHLSAFLEQRDVDGDGMVEATQSGNDNTLIEPARSSCWWDALNTGYKDGYSNALIYRAWRCLADLEAKLARKEKQAHYTRLAERLKAVYRKTLYNPSTGWLAWWKSQDGALHDYATPIVNGMAISFGLVHPEEGRKILSRLYAKMESAAFSRFDLGLPCTLEPVRRADYLQPSGLGVPHRADGTDTFQMYMNGGISAGHTLHFILAGYAVGEPQKADALLHAMLTRQATIGFQDGVQNEANKGIDWTNWTGAPKGYEGYLADVFMFLQAAVLREPALRARFYRPLH